LTGHFEPVKGTDTAAFSYAQIPGVPAARGLVTWGVVASLAVVGATTLPLPDAAQMFGFKPADPMAGAGLPLISSFYVHVGISHLLVNLYFLAALGDRVESMLGSRRYLVTLFAGTVFGSLAYALGGPTSVAPMVGAAAGISAVIVLYALSAPRARVSVFIFVDAPRLSVWSFLGIWILIQVVGDFAMWGAGSDVPYSLQLAGCFVGLLAWFGVLFEAPDAAPGMRATRSRR
jgi:membrane associated rhomboid family serine protease